MRLPRPFYASPAMAPPLGRRRAPPRHLVDRTLRSRPLHPSHGQAGDQRVRGEACERAGEAVTPSWMPWLTVGFICLLILSMAGLGLMVRKERRDLRKRIATVLSGKDYSSGRD